jgi:cell division protein FtsW
MLNNYFKSIDKIFLFIVIALIIEGLIAISTASIPQAILGSKGDEISLFQGYQYTKNQLLFTLGGLFLIWVISAFFKPEILRKVEWPLYFIAMGFMLLPLFIGKEIGGNRAWVQIGSNSVQPSEFGKIALVLMLASFIDRHPDWVRRWKTEASIKMELLFIILLPIAIVGAQRDIGTALVMSLSTLIILTISGMKMKLWASCVAGGICLALAMGLVLPKSILEQSKRIERFAAWTHVKDRKIQAAFQPLNSLIAISSGGLLGRGYGEGIQKWYYLPEPHNDYIFATIAEEFGFLFGTVIIFITYGLLLWRGFSIASLATDNYGTMLVAGSMVFLLFQAIINLSVVSNLLWCMGICLPFISAGGSSLIGSCIFVGLILMISRKNQKKRREEPAFISE